MVDSTRRAIRGALQLVAGILVSLGAIFLIPGINEQMEKLGFGQAFGIFGLVVLILTTVVTKAQNYFEDETKFPALLKAPSSEGQNPQPDPLKNPQV